MQDKVVYHVLSCRSQDRTKFLVSSYPAVQDTRTTELPCPVLVSDRNRTASVISACLFNNFHFI